MPFDSRPLVETTKPRMIGLPPIKISSKPWKNTILVAMISLLEHRLLGIKSKNFEICEHTYQTPPEFESSLYPENNYFNVRHYKASSDMAVIVLPQRGGGYNVAQLIAAYLASNGINAYEIETPFRGSRLPQGKNFKSIVTDPETLKTTFEQAITETRSLIDIVEEEKVGICGVSLGAIYASVVYGVDDRLSSAYLLLGGGNLAHMLLESNESFAQAFRKHNEGISESRLAEELEVVEPTRYTANNPGNLIMVNATQDKGIPLECADRLWEAWRNPQQHLINAGHVSIAMYTPSLLRDMLHHYERTLL